DAVHALLEVDVLQMDGNAGAAVRPALDGRLDGRLRARRRGVRDRIAARVEEAALPVVFEDRAEDPAVPVEVGELRQVELGVQVGRALEEVGAGDRPRVTRLLGVEVRPETAQRAALWIAARYLVLLLGRRVTLVGRIHVLAVRLVVPPRVAEVRVREGRAG